jgi:hypothetical protein
MQRYSPARIRSRLQNFLGTSQYRRYFNYLLTDGAVFVAYECGAFWLLDLIISYQNLPRFTRAKIQIWTLTLETKTSSGVVVCCSLNGEELVRQEILLTDFPLSEGVELWKIDQVICLPSEN